MGRYRYSQLDEGANEIRLLTLLPGKFRSFILVAIHEVRLTREEIPTYEALYYAWVSRAKQSDVRVGCHQDRLAVTQNLASALRHLRHLEGSRILWVDAICIDQQNLKERSNQVQRMGDVYTLANRVVVWLGPKRDDSGYAMDLMTSLGSRVYVD